MESPMNGKATLDVLRKRFSEWRAGKKSRRDAIPKELWDDAIHLAQSNSVAHVSKVLGLCASTLKQKVFSQRELKPKSVEAPTFVKANLRAVVSPGPTSSSEIGWRLTIERPDGTTLKLAAPRTDRDDLLKVAIQFLG